MSYLLYKLEELHKYLPAQLYAFFQWYMPDIWYRHLSVKEAVGRFFKNQRLKYKIYSLKELIDNKKSDTLFICGTNRSVNEIDESSWNKIADHDSLGLNYFIYHTFCPTFYALEYGRDDLVNKHHTQLIRNRNIDYKNSIFLISSRHRRRGIHPRILPEFFVDNSKVSFFLYPKVLQCPDSRPFTANDFKKTMYYRGSLNLYLYFARLLEYKKIVLLGCEMDSEIPFYEDYHESQWMHTIEGYQRSYDERKQMRYGLSYNSKGLHNMVTTILAVNEYVFKPEGIELYVFNKKSLLYPKVPLFE